MATSDEQKAKLGELAARALDSIEQDFGPDASLRDAVLVYEVDLGGDETMIRYDATEARAPVVTGLLTLALQSILDSGSNGPPEDEG